MTGRCASEAFELFGAIVGSISFWGSAIAFGKLQEILPGRPIKLPGAAQSVLNLLLFTIAVVSAVVLAAGTHSQALFILGILVASAALGDHAGAADRRRGHAGGHLAV